LTKFVQKIKTHFVFTIFFFENLAVYEINWKNVVEWGRAQTTIWRTRIACWIPKATNTHTHTHTNTGCVILIFSHSNIGCTDAPRCYVIPASPVWIYFLQFYCTITHFNRFVIFLRNVITTYVKTYHIFATRISTACFLLGYLNYSQDLRNLRGNFREADMKLKIITDAISEQYLFIILRLPHD